MSEIDTARQITDHVNQATKGLEAWARASAETAKDLQRINSLLETASALGKVSASLAVLSGALGVASALLGSLAPSVEELILDGVERIEQTMSQLEGILLAQFDHLESKVEWENAKSQVRGGINDLATLRSLVAAYAANQRNEVAAEDVEARLREFPRDRVLAAVESFASQATGEELATDIFQAGYELSYGSLETIRSIGSTLLSFATFGLMADSLLGRIQSPKGGEDPGRLVEAARVSQELFGPLLVAIADRWREWHERCIADAIPNMERKLEERIFPRTPSIEHQPAAEAIHGALQETWFWFDWLVIVYAPVRGNDRHHLIGNDTKSYFGQPLAGFLPANVVIHWAQPGHEPRTGLHPSAITDYMIRHFVPFLHGSGGLSAQQMAESVVRDFRPRGTFLVWVARAEPGVGHTRDMCVYSDRANLMGEWGLLFSA